MARPRTDWDLLALITELERVRPGRETSTQGRSLAYKDALDGYLVSIIERLIDLYNVRKLAREEQNYNFRAMSRFVTMRESSAR